MQDDIGTERGTMFVVHDVARCVTDVRLRVVVDAAFQSLTLQEFVEDGLSPVALHAVAESERAVQFVGTLHCRFTLPHHILDIRLHLTAHLRLLLCVLRHHLLHLVDGFAQRVDNLSEVLVAGIGKFLLPLFQHLVGSHFHLGGDLLHRFVKLPLLCTKCLLMHPILLFKRLLEIPVLLLQRILMGAFSLLHQR